MENQKINIRLRLVIIKSGKLLTQYKQKLNYYYYIGGHLDYGETILEGCAREISEECNGANFEFKKILYVRDFLVPEKNEHSVELFILGDVDKFEELEHWFDPLYPNNDVWSTWLDINNLPDNLFPHPLSKKLLSDYKTGFLEEGKYIGKMNE